jgi:PAS domain S-box-containing protein
MDSREKKDEPPSRPSQIVRSDEHAREPHAWLHGDIDVADVDEKDTKRLFRALFEWIPTAATLRDVSDWRLIGFNAAAVQLLGCSTEQQLGSLVANNVANELQPDGTPSTVLWSALVARAMETGTGRAEIWVRRATGELFLAEVRQSTVNLRGRRVMLTLVDDITDRRRGEAALQRRAEREALLTQISRRFVGGDVGAAIAGALADVGAWTGASQAWLSMVLEGGAHAALADGAEEDIVMLRAVAELIAVARARQDAERALAHTTNDAIAASLTKSVFLATMSHDLRTPLGGVIGMVDLLAHTPLDARQSRYVEVARTSANLLLSVIDGILDFAKIEAGKVELAELELSVADVIGDVITMFTLAAEQKGLSLSCHTSPLLSPAVVGDAARLTQILANLVGNAIKFTIRGSVHVEAQPAHDDPRKVRFEIRDSGIGIPPGARSKLFLPFSQLHGPSATRDRGTGLGLAICRELVERMGGRIDVEARPEGGSTFWFEIAFARAAEG